jgi:hypothetical protein
MTQKPEPLCYDRPTYLLTPPTLVDPISQRWSQEDERLAPFGCADKPAEKHRLLICCERKILFRLKKQAEKDGL